MEGAQAVREALRYGRVREVFATEAAAARYTDLLVDVPVHLVPLRIITEAAAAALSETVTPQGLVAVCDLVDVPLAAALAGPAGPVPLVVVCVDIADPGNAGTVIRVADAAGAGAVVLAGDTVDPHNGKAVRASTGSVFHLPLARHHDARGALDACGAAGLTLLVADARGELDLHDPAAAPVLAGPVAWIFGGEAHGTPPAVGARADHRVAIPIPGRAESLNLATAAAVCLYATVAARRARS